MGSFKTDGKALLIVFMAIIIAAAFISPIANQVSATTSTITVTNKTYTAPAVNSTLAIVGRQLLSQTGNIALANNFSNFSNGVFLASEIGSDGELSVVIRVNQTGIAFAGASVNVSYTAEPDGYQNAATRPIVLLIVLIAALALLVVVIVTFMKEGSLKDFMKK